MIPTPKERSPHGLIQERLRHDPWRLLVAVIMLNQTSIKQVAPVFERFIQRWPTPQRLLEADHSEIAELIRTCGFQNRRARTIMKMSESFIAGFKDVLELPGIGKYGRDSYHIFVSPGYLVLDVQDKELKRYVEWALERADKGADRRSLQEAGVDPQAASKIAPEEGSRRACG